MSDSAQPSDDESGTDRSVTRRTVLNGAIGTGALALGTGVVAANGKGGQGFVDADAVEESEGTFEFKSEEVQDGRDDYKGFDCNGKAGLPFPYWEIRVDGYDDNPVNLYTRDNSIDTDETYRWTNDKKCNDDFKQVGFAKD